MKIFAFQDSNELMHAENGKKVKFRIFKLTYKTQFWSYEHVTNMFLVRFDLKKHLRTISEHFEHHKHIFGRAEAPSWR